jgi:hypothetical protein
MATITYGNKIGQLSATYTGFALTGPSSVGETIWIQRDNLTNVGTGSTFAVDMVRDPGTGSSMPAELLGAPIAYGVSQSVAAGITLTTGQYLRLRTSAAGVIDCTIDYQRIVL